MTGIRHGTGWVGRLGDVVRVCSLVEVVVFVLPTAVAVLVAVTVAVAIVAVAAVYVTYAVGGSVRVVRDALLVVFLGRKRRFPIGRLYARGGRNRVTRDVSGEDVDRRLG